MTKTDDYRRKLASLADWDPFLLKESGLPGPRANLELAQVVAEMGDAARLSRYLSFDPVQAPTNSPYEFLAFCGVVGLGQLLADGNTEALETLRALACDPRWRIREGVAMALQRWGDEDMGALLRAMKDWSKGNALEQRAAAAALCEPRLLGHPKHVRQVLKILDRITAAIGKSEDRKSAEFQALRKGLGYFWSVAVTAAPVEGPRAMEKWFSSRDPDIQWIMRENLKKNRLERMNARWVAGAKARLGMR